MIKLKKLALVLIGLAALTAPKAWATGQFFGYAQRGGLSVTTASQESLTKVQRSFPGATIKVCIANTSCSSTGGGLAVLFSDSSGTAKANPFTAGSDASFLFWTNTSVFDIVFYGPGITTTCGSVGQLPCIAPFTWTSQSFNGSASTTNTVFNVKDFGAKGDLRTVTDASISSGSAALSSVSAAFTLLDVGKQVQIAGAGAAGVTLYTTISAFVGTTQVTVALAASTSVSGATAKVYTDDGVAIGLASAALQSNGSGTLYFPPGTYGTYGKGTVYTGLGIFTSLTNVNLQCDGCTIYASGEHTNTSSGGVSFLFTSTVGVTVDGFNVQGELPRASALSANFFGITFLEFLHDCALVNIPKLRVRNIQAPVVFNNNTTGTYDGLPHTKGVHIGILDVGTCTYGLSAQYSMDDAVIDSLRTDVVARSMFIYGSVNVTANIHSKDASSDDVKLWGLAGIGLTNIHINYYMGAESTSKQNAGNLVTLDYLGNTSVTHRNIWVNFDVTYAGTGTNNTGSSWFQINKYTASGSAFDLVDRGHVLDGLTLSGNITNYPNDGGICGAEIPSPNSKWGPTLDSWYNIHLSNLSLTNAKCVRLGLAALKGPVLVDNFRNDFFAGTLVIEADDYIGAPNHAFPSTGGPIKILNSSYPNQYAPSNGDLPSGIITISGNVAVGVAWQGQRINNDFCVGTCTATLPPAVIGREYIFDRTVANAFRMAPQATDLIRGASAVNKYISMNVIGTRLMLTCNATGVWDVRYFSAPTDYSFEP